MQQERERERERDFFLFWFLLPSWLNVADYGGNMIIIIWRRWYILVEKTTSY